MWGQPRPVFEYRNPLQIEAHRVFIQRKAEEAFAARRALAAIETSRERLAGLQLETEVRETNPDPTQFPGYELVPILQSRVSEWGAKQRATVRRLEQDVVDYEQHYHYLYRHWSSNRVFRHFIQVARGWGQRPARRVRNKQLPDRYLVIR